MACRTETVGSFEYDFCPEALPSAADRTRAVLRGRFLDETTGRPLGARLSVSSSTPGLAVATAANGVAGLVANPARRYPGLATDATEIDFTVRAHRFLERTFRRTLGPVNTGNGAPADFPEHFAPIDLGDVDMHRQPSVIRGRVVRNHTVPRTPLDGATVTIDGIWSVFPSADVDLPTVREPANILALARGLYAERSAGAAVLRSLPITRVPTTKRLLDPVVSGDTRIRLSDRVDLVPGQLLAIEAAGSDRAEYIEVTAVDGAIDPAQPAVVALAHPCSTLHRVGVEAARAAPGAAGGPNTLLRDAIVGDATIVLDGLVDLPDAGVVEISGGGPTAEFHDARLYLTQSDAAGYFALPPLSRVAQIELLAAHPDPPAPITVLFSPDYQRYENALDLVFA